MNYLQNNEKFLKGISFGNARGTPQRQNLNQQKNGKSIKPPQPK